MDGIPRFLVGKIGCTTLTLFSVESKYLFPEFFLPEGMTKLLFDIFFGEFAFTGLYLSFDEFLFKLFAEF